MATLPSEIEDLGQRAVGAYQDGDYEEAQRLWEEILRADPSNTDATRGLRMISLLAERESPGVSEHHEGDPLQSAVDEVESLLESGHVSEAMSTAATLLAQNPDDPRVRETHDAALRAYESEPFIREQIDRAALALESGQPDRARACYRKVLAIDEKNREALELLAKLGSQGSGSEAHRPLSLGAPVPAAGPVPEPPPTPHPEPRGGSLRNAGASVSGSIFELDGESDSIPLGKGEDALDIDSLDAEVDRMLSPLGGSPSPQAPVRFADNEEALDLEDFGLPRVPPAGTLPPLGEDGEEFELGSAVDITAAPENPPDDTLEGLLAQARAAFEVGSFEVSISKAAQAQVMDPENTSAVEIEEQAREALERRTREIEDMIYEASRCMDRKDWSSARNFLIDVIKRQHDHAEAQDMLDRVTGMMRRAEGEEPAGEEAAGASGVAGADHDTSIPLSKTQPNDTTRERQAAGGLGTRNVALAGDPDDTLPGGAIPLVRDPRKQDEFDPALDLPAARSERRRRTGDEAGTPARSSLTSSLGRVLLAVVAVVVLGAGGYYGYNTFFAAPSTDTPTVSPAEARAARRKAAAEKAAAETAAADPAGQDKKPSGSTPAAEGKSAPVLFGEGKAAFEQGRLEQAVGLLRASVSLDPTNAGAQDLLKVASENLLAEQEADRQMTEASKAFREEQWDDALRLLYRLPESMAGSDVERYKRNAWYNLSLRDLMAGDTRAAMEHLDEALTIDPNDSDAAHARKFAETYQNREKDRTYYDYAEDLPRRKMTAR